MQVTIYYYESYYMVSLTDYGSRAGRALRFGPRTDSVDYGEICMDEKYRNEVNDIRRDPGLAAGIISTRFGQRMQTGDKR